MKSTDAVWRGIGRIPKSGYKISDEFAQNDAIKKFGLKINSDASVPPGCACDQVLIGKIFPEQCPLFGRLCTPEKPVGSCMVSHEESCKIAYTFSLLKYKYHKI
ncbi:MAG: hypothetical protein ACTSVL_09385 [Promethearchaeota archaeon]